MRPALLQTAMRFGGLRQRERLAEGDPKLSAQHQTLQIISRLGPALRRVRCEPEAADLEAPIVQLIWVDRRWGAARLPKEHEMAVGGQSRQAVRLRCTSNRIEDRIDTASVRGCANQLRQRRTVGE